MERWADKIRASASIYVNALSAGNYDLVPRLDRQPRFTAEELRQRVEATGMTLVQPPLWAWSGLEILPHDEGEGLQFLVAFPLCADDGSQGPLTLTLRMWPDPRERNLRTEILDLAIRPSSRE